MDKVSVIIPTYNREKTIVRAIRSVLEQTYYNLEVLVIDDGSTDDTVQKVKGIADDRLQYIILEQNGGAANARNEGVKRATGEWIAFQDSDDCWLPDKIEKQMNYVKEHPQYAMVYGLMLVHMEQGEVVQAPYKPWPEVMEGKMLQTLLMRNVIGTPIMLMKRDCFVEVGGFDVSYSALEDWEFAIRFAKQYEIGFVREILMESYVLSGGVSSKKGAYYEARCKMLVQYKEEIVQLGMLDAVMKDILTRAQESGILDAVKSMMLLYLGGQIK